MTTNMEHLQGKTIAAIVNTTDKRLVLRFTDGTHLRVEATTYSWRNDWTGRDEDLPTLIVVDTKRRRGK